MTKKMIFSSILVTLTLLLQYGCKSMETAKEPEPIEQSQTPAVVAQIPAEVQTPTETQTTTEPVQATPAKVEEPVKEPAPTETKKIAIRVNCGTEEGAQPYTDKEGKVWQPDRLMTDDLDWGAMDGQIIQRPTLDIQDTNCPDIYKSETYSMSAYKFKVPKGKYTVTLHFAETYEGISGPGERVFSVAINGKEVLKDLDPFKEAGKFATPVVKKFNGIEPVDGAITISFTPNVENPQICGIEVVSEEPSDNKEASGKSGGFVLRVNTGYFGDAYTDKAGNVWQPDQEKTNDNKWGADYGQTIERPGLNIPGTDCPLIYESERYSMDDYKFDVPNGKYTVKLHFAETFEGIYGVGERVFSVSINGKEVFKDVDPYKDAGEFNKPDVKTIKDVEPVNGQIVIGFTPNIENPQINGIEIIQQ